MGESSWVEIKVQNKEKAKDICRNKESQNIFSAFYQYAILILPSHFLGSTASVYIIVVPEDKS